MKAHCPACGRATRVAEDVLDFLVRCERCRTMLLARSPAADLASVKAEVLPLGRMPERFGVAARTDLADLLTRPRRRTLSGTTRSVVRGAAATRGHGLAGLCMAIVTAIMLATVIGAGYWKLHIGARHASAAAPAIRGVANDPEKSPAPPTSPPASPAESPVPADAAKTLSPVNTPTGTGELFPDVAAQN